MRQQLLRPFNRIGGALQRLLQPFGGEIGDGVERQHHVAERLPAMVEQLHDGADTDGGEKGDNEDRNGAAEQGLGRQQASVGRLGN